MLLYVLEVVGISHPGVDRSLCLAWQVPVSLAGEHHALCQPWLSVLLVWLLCGAPRASVTGGCEPCLCTQQLSSAPGLLCLQSFTAFPP